MRKRCLCMLLAGVIFTGGGVSIVCLGEGRLVKEESVVQPMHENVSTALANLKVTDTGISMTTSVKTSRKCSIRIMMMLKKKLGITWKTVNTWFKYTGSARTLYLKKEYSVTSGTYKVESSITAGEEEIVIDSAIKTK